MVALVPAVGEPEIAKVAAVVIVDGAVKAYVGAEIDTALCVEKDPDWN